MAAPVFVCVFLRTVGSISLALSKFVLNFRKTQSKTRSVAEGAGLPFGWFIIFILAENVDFGTKY